jgi:hypothetical protein
VKLVLCVGGWCEWRACTPFAHSVHHPHSESHRVQWLIAANRCAAREMKRMLRHSDGAACWTRRLVEAHIRTPAAPLNTHRPLIWGLCERCRRHHAHTHTHNCTRRILTDKKCGVASRDKIKRTTRVSECARAGFATPPRSQRALRQHAPGTTSGCPRSKKTAEILVKTDCKIPDV